MRKVALIFFVLFCICVGITYFPMQEVSSDSYLRNRIVKLEQPGVGSCTGVEVLTSKNVVYTLTAGHCRALLDEHKQIVAEDEQGGWHFVSFVAEDNQSDLMLLTSMQDSGVMVAGSLEPHEKVKAITHGHGLAAFRTDGEIIETQSVAFAEEMLHNETEALDCINRAPKAEIIDIDTLFEGKIKVCVIKTLENIATNFILPGSSGGPLFNLQGQLVGIASASSQADPFGRFVRLEDIQEFLKDR